MRKPSLRGSRLARDVGAIDERRQQASGAATNVPVRGARRIRETTVSVDHRLAALRFVHEQRRPPRHTAADGGRTANGLSHPGQAGGGGGGSGSGAVYVRAFCHSAKRPHGPHLQDMKNTPFNIIISGQNYECRVFGETEGEAANAAENLLLQLRQEADTFPSQLHIECSDVEAAKRMAAYFADITVEPDLG